MKETEAIGRYSLARCECSVFVKRKSQKQWTETKNYILRTQVSRPIKLTQGKKKHGSYAGELGNSANVEAKIFLRKELKYSFSFCLDNGEFSLTRQPPDVTLRWSGRRRCVLLLEHEGKTYRLVARSGWFPKQTGVVWIDLEDTAEIIRLKGESTLVFWSRKKRQTELPRKGVLLRPGCYLHLADGSYAEIKFNGEKVRVFHENTIIVFRPSAKRDSPDETKENPG
jgi:hypothetical protein